MQFDSPHSTSTMSMPADSPVLSTENSVNGLAGLLPEGRVKMAVARLSEPWTEDTSRLFPEERMALAGMSEKRRREFVAGRILARSLFAEFGIGPHAVRQNHDRSPEWPAGIIGSITHTDDICVVAMGREEHLCALGIDIERRRALEQELWEYICGEDEIDALPSSINSGEGACWIFCAKEAYYKAQFPHTGSMLSFRDLKVILEVHTATFRVQCNHIGKSEIFDSGVGRLWRSGAHLGAVWLVAV